MIGINTESLNSIINRTIEAKDSYINDSKRLSNIIDSLESCYNGNYINYLFDDTIEKCDELKNIEKVLSNYIEVLDDVKKSYIKQNDIFKDQMSHVSSNL